MNRKSFLALGVGLAVVVLASSFPAGPALAEGSPLAAVDADPAAPVSGNPKGDVTIVEFSDYNCPFCKTSAAALEKLVAADPGVRVVHKELPILTEASLYGAKLALAAKYQGKYGEAHASLMGIPGVRIPEGRMREAVEKAGVDMARLDADLKAHDKDIADQLRRNLELADVLGLQGTPAFVVGPYLIPSAIDLDSFKRVVAEARAKTQG